MAKATEAERVAFNAGYDAGHKQGNEDACIDMLNCSMNHSDLCDCAGCDWVKWICDGVKPSWVKLQEEGDR